MTMWAVVCSWPSWWLYEEEIWPLSRWWNGCCYIWKAYLHFSAETLGYRLLPGLRVQSGGDLVLQSLWSCMSSVTFCIRYDLVHGTRVSWIFLCGHCSELQGCSVFPKTVSFRRCSCLPLTTTIFGLKLVTVTSIDTVVAGSSEAFRPGRSMWIMGTRRFARQIHRHYWSNKLMHAYRCIGPLGGQSDSRTKCGLLYKSTYCTEDTLGESTVKCHLWMLIIPSPAQLHWC